MMAKSPPCMPDMISGSAALETPVVTSRLTAETSRIRIVTAARLSRFAGPPSREETYREQYESMVLKAALVCMVRHLRRELSRQRLAKFNLPLEWNGKADA